MNHSDIKEALKWRYATKKFDASKKIPAADWKVLAESLQMAPSSYGLQPWQFLVVENPELREKLKAASWNQSQVTDSSHYVVLVYKEKLDTEHIQKHINNVADARGVSHESLDGFKNMMVENLVNGPRAQTIDVWAQRQTYIAMGFLMETAALMKIDACPMEGLDPAAYDKILGLEGSGWKTVATVALGYRSADDAYQNLKKVRFNDEHVLKYIK
jgi:nitroreductase